MDIINYLVYAISMHTCEEFQSYKSLEAHGHLTTGWVKDLVTFQLKDCDTTKDGNQEILPVENLYQIDPLESCLRGY